jgi:hypothetical protein
MKQKLFATALILVLFILGCAKTGRLDILDNDAPAPTAISNVQNLARPGSVLLRYAIPEDPNLYYVKAVYEIRPGVLREAKSSFYADSLELVGFGDTNEYEVKLYSVGRNEKESSPVTIKVKPLEPPVQTVFQSLNMIPTFGGISIQFQNMSKANIMIGVLVDTTGNQTWAPANNFYTAAIEGGFSVRGYDATEKRFAVFIKDRWNNKSDTLIKNLTPLYEERFDRLGIKPLILPTDAQVLGPNNDVTKLFDGKLGGTDPYGTTNASVLPQWFTIDFGKPVVISRFKSYQRPAPFSYSLAAVKIFELYGSNNPASDGSWDSWTLLGKFNSFKPSGLPMGQASDEDVNYAAIQGEDFAFESLQAPYRYLRYKTLETWDMGGQVAITELAFWGQPMP